MDNTDEISPLRRQNNSEIDPENEHKNNIKQPKGKRGFQKGEPKPEWKNQRWQGDDEAAFYNWLEDIKPRVKQGNRYEIFRPNEEQSRIISAIFARENNHRKHRIVMAIQPRRHGKSTVNLLVSLFYFTARKNITIGLLGNSDDHCHRTMFKRLEAIVRNTPELKKRVDPDKNFLNDYARLQDPERSTTWQNRIIKCSVSMAGAFGEALDILIASDLHATQDMEPFEAWRAALLDASEGISLIDSNVDSIGGPIHNLEKLAEEDEAVWCSHIEYENLEDYNLRAPAWINRTEARIASKRDLETSFNRDFLGKRSSAVNSLFPEILIQGAMDSYRMPVENIRYLTHGRPYKIGVGLDRAKLLSPLMGGDHSILSTIAKVAQTNGEPEYYVLDLTDFLMNTSKAIKSKIISDHKKFGITNAVLENFEVMDLVPFLAEQQINHEVIHATDVAQNAIFPEFHRIVKDGRLHIPVNCTQLADEMRTFIYTQKKYGSYSFGHSSQQFHDDAVYATAWAIFSLRNEILTVYKLDHIDCFQHSAIKRNLCFMMGGSLQLGCSQQCRAFHEVREMFKDFLAFNQLDSELSIPDFYRAYVKASDAVIQFQAM